MDVFFLKTKQKKQIHYKRVHALINMQLRTGISFMSSNHVNTSFLFVLFSHKVLIKSTGKVNTLSTYFDRI